MSSKKFEARENILRKRHRPRQAKEALFVELLFFFEFLRSREIWLSLLHPGGIGHFRS